MGNRLIEQLVRLVERQAPTISHAKALRHLQAADKKSVFE
jgi:hypothetical protein